jgi:hypothetical protein
MPFNARTSKFVVRLVNTEPPQMSQSFRVAGSIHFSLMSVSASARVVGAAVFHLFLDQLLHLVIV